MKQINEQPFRYIWNIEINKSLEQYMREQLWKDLRDKIHNEIWVELRCGCIYDNIKI